MDARATVHQIVDRLSDDELGAAKRLLERLHSAGVDPLLKALASAPYDDEPSSPEENASSKEAWDQRGDSLSAEDARRKYL